MRLMDLKFLLSTKRFKVYEIQQIVNGKEKKVWVSEKYVIDYLKKI